MTVVFNLGADRIRLVDGDDPSREITIRGHVLSGARSRYFVVNTEDMVQTIGIQFKPGGAFPFFRMPASELQEQSISLDDIFGAEARHIRDRLLETSSPEQKFQLLECWLLDRLAKPLQRHRAVEFALQRLLQNPAQSVSALSDRIGISQRRFIQIFSSEVGLTPKLFARVRRFQSSIQELGIDTEVEWTDLALRCGYYDQAHFNHDFQGFCGLTPRSYVAHRTAHLNHVPILE